MIKRWAHKLSPLWGTNTSAGLIGYKRIRVPGIGVDFLDCPVAVSFGKGYASDVVDPVTDADGNLVYVLPGGGRSTLYQF